MNACRQSKNTRLTFSEIELAQKLFGEQDAHLKRLADLLVIHIHARGNTVHLKGDDVAVDLSRRVLEQLYGLLKEKYPVYPNDIDYALRILKENHSADLKKIFLDTVYIT
jgi:phosphate starvation-inducible protein PhoH and related proteins